MKAITIRQPWASLIATGLKGFETRSWSTKHRGKLAIHAGVSKDSYGTTPAHQVILSVAGSSPEWQEYILRCADTPSHEIPFGAIVAICDVAECYRIGVDAVGIYIERKDASTGCWEKFDYIENRKELMFGEWLPGWYAWELVNVRILETPIPAKGKQGFWEWDG